MNNHFTRGTTRYALAKNLFAATVLSWLALAGLIQPAAAQAIRFTYLTLTNPIPGADNYFGSAVAAVGTDRVLIGAREDDTGATNAGAAYLFSIDGALLATFTNPNLDAHGNFGGAVAAVGTNRLLIGAPGGASGSGGVAFLFQTNGNLLTTFTNPTPAVGDTFGISVAAVGSDRVLIGAPYDDTGATNSGVVYLFSINGTLLTTFTNPAPTDDSFFGYAITGAGTDSVLIGAHFNDTGAPGAGAAYLFSTNGVLLTTFTNPTPADADAFGESVAAVGSDRVLIGAPGGDPSGVAYLFSTNGTLLVTITNPFPEVAFPFSDSFGGTVAAVGADRVLIAAPLHGGLGNQNGAVYLFGTSGLLLSTFTSPAPAASDVFGSSMAVVGTDRVLIGARGDLAGATNSGAAYLFTLESAPRLTTTRSVSNVVISWPSPSTDFALQQNTNLNTTNWMSPSEIVTDNGTIKLITIDLPTGSRFYRLFKP